ncbi:hypothetical protein JCM11641_006721 [Rhodosporidiobolus odoratus]
MSRPTSLLLFLFLTLSSIVPCALAQFDISAPSCCRTCYTSMLTRVDAGEFEGLKSIADTVKRCRSGEFGGRLMECWNESCDSPTEIATGKSIWEATCNFADSTRGSLPFVTFFPPARREPRARADRDSTISALEAQYQSVYSSFSERVATETTLAVMGKRAPTTPLPITDRRAPQLIHQQQAFPAAATTTSAASSVPLGIGKVAEVVCGAVTVMMMVMLLA